MVRLKYYELRQVPNQSRVPSEYNAHHQLGKRIHLFDPLPGWHRAQGYHLGQYRAQRKATSRIRYRLRKRVKEKKDLL